MPEPESATYDNPSSALDGLGFHDKATCPVCSPKQSLTQWRVEREETVLILRALCVDFGLDNSWPDDLHLADVLRNINSQLAAREER